MRKHTWHPKEPIDAVIFDCDSTLSAVEGIAVLAEQNGVYDEVHGLTEEAMAVSGMNTNLYRARLDLVKPSQLQLQALGSSYWDAVTPHVMPVIQTLHALGKTVYVVSAGIQEAVVDFAEKLNIPSANVFAVHVYFDASGQYKDFDSHSPLATSTGKSEIVAMLRQKFATVAHIGDGMNDVEAAKSVDRFIGYGGACYRQSIADLSQYYLTCASMTPVLPLLLTEQEAMQLTPESQVVYQQGVALMSEVLGPHRA